MESHAAFRIPNPALGFSLIELLVVATVIVVLMALLAPALDQAVYRAELAVCAARLRGVASGITIYAMNNKRQFIERRGIAADGEMPVYAWRPNTINDSISWDDRPNLLKFLPVNKLLNCPLTRDVDFEASYASTIIEADYNLWFGFRYPGSQGMRKLGDKITWAGERYSVLADDYDMLNVQANDDHATHPDREGTMMSIRSQDEGAGLVWTMSRWATQGTFKRSPMDRNFAYDDGSVLVLNALVIDPVTGQQDERLEVLPPFAESADTVNHKNSLPKE